MKILVIFTGGTIGSCEKNGSNTIRVKSAGFEQFETKLE
jgi:L-asparaginase/Glu-tRNA(Gln) amidotransferase subunit D